MVRRPAAATWMPFAALVLLAGISAHLTQEAPQRPGARLLAAVEAFCVAVADGELERATAHLAPNARSPMNVERVARASAQRRGASWLVVSVDPDKGTTTVVWGEAISDQERPQDVLHWAVQPNGTWKLVL